MAITQSHPRLKLTISIDNVALEEYTDEDEELQPDVVVKYIEAVSGAEFSIDCELSLPWPHQSLMLDVIVDGKWVRGALFNQQEFSGIICKRSVSGVNHSKGREWFLQKFCFSDLIVDDTGVCRAEDQLMKELKQMGEITIKAFHVTNIRQTDVGLDQKKIKNVDVIPEKALKGRSLSHQSSLRPPVKTDVASRVYDYDYVDPVKKAFATFTFRYRSRASLQSLLIIPRSPSPVALEDKDVDTLTPEEMRELLRRQRERDAATRNVKREHGVKRERTRERSSTANEVDDDELSFVSAKRRRHPVTLNEDGVETVDLT